jgi:predicted DsbA family dithiol-disulfide isomerase
VSGAPVRVRHFTDPACPFAFSAERHRQRLRWLYGDQIEWTLHLVVLREERPAPEDWPTDRHDAGRRRLFEENGMPLDWSVPPPASSSWPACLAVAAARRHSDDRACARILRALRVRAMAQLAPDEDAVIDGAIREAGLEPTEVRDWMADPDVEADLRRDMAEARSPSAAARAQDYKLGGPAGERRYSCPSYEFFRTAPAPPDWAVAARFDLPGYRPLEAYETTLANIAPELTRRADPSSVGEVLRWAEWPLATAEVAAVCERPIADVRAELARSEARFRPAGGDGYWSLPREAHP